MARTTHRTGTLVVDGTPSASAAVAATTIARARGLLGRDGLEGALLVPARSVHTVGMRFPLDIALLAPASRGYAVVAVHTVAPGRLIPPRRRVRAVLEAEAGRFERWGLVTGSHVDIVGVADA